MRNPMRKLKVTLPSKPENPTYDLIRLLAKQIVQRLKKKADQIGLTPEQKPTK